MFAPAGLASAWHGVDSGGDFLSQPKMKGQFIHCGILRSLQATSTSISSQRCGRGQCFFRHALLPLVAISVKATSSRGVFYLIAGLGVLHKVGKTQLHKGLRLQAQTFSRVQLAQLRIRCADGGASPPRTIHSPSQI
mmetsp:Transcript_26253/g.87004  ORF Transcript_26253/g.87004 Transcript_26253/m.87004 type:complete len:137 (+) Transcript_26253:617-1027(+)